MASLHSSHFLSASSHLQIALHTRHHALFPSGFKHGSLRYSLCGSKPRGAHHSSASNIVSWMSISAGQPGDPRREKLDHLTRKAKKLWDNAPQPVKNFPWNQAIDNFVQLIVDLILEVVKYLSVPLLLVTSLSEMSYCAHQRKLKLVIIPLVVGITIAGVLKEAAMDLYPRLKDAEVPWHLIVVAIFFTLLKLPGPYYPYWGRILIPHFANGGLFRTIWFTFLWSRRPKQASSETTLAQDSEDKS